MTPDTRPCTCDVGAPFDGEYRAKTQCRACWLWHNRDKTPPEASTPGIVAKTVSFVTATATWLSENAPVRSQEDQDVIFDTHCRPCPELDVVGTSCKKCGCVLRGQLLNKIRMATEHCPIGKW